MLFRAAHRYAHLSTAGRKNQCLSEILPLLGKVVADMSLRENAWGILKNVERQLETSGAFLGCLRHAKKDFSRVRKLTLGTVIFLLLRMHGGTLDSELLEVRKSRGLRVTASAFVQARAKVKPQLLEKLFRAFNATMVHPATYRGYRLLIIDGSDFRLQDNPASRNVASYKNTKACCLLHCNALYDAENHVVLDAVLQPKSISNERTAAIEMMMRHTDEPFIVIMDAGYPSLLMLACADRIKNCHYIIRSGLNLRELRELPDAPCDLDMDFIIRKKGGVRITSDPDSQALVHRIGNTKSYPKDLEDPCRVHCRVVKIFLPDHKGGGKWEVLLTNLSREAFSATEIGLLYQRRWQIETAFRNLKFSLTANAFHSRQDEFVEQELWAHIIMYNVISRMASIVAVSQGARRHPYRLNFKMTVRVVHDYIDKKKFSIERLIEDLLPYQVPVRPDRSYARRLSQQKAVDARYRAA